MSVSARVEKYPLTIRFIYSTCAQRLKKRKLSLSLVDAEIAEGVYDRKVVNRIMNNTRSRNNPYLIPPAYVKPLAEELGLESDYELFWGDMNNEDFTESLFCKLVTDILDESDWNENYWDEPYWSKNIARVDMIQKVLLDDVAYAKVFPSLGSRYEYESPEGIYYPLSPLAYVNDDEQVPPSERKQVRQNAIIRLYRNTRPVEMFRAFFEEVNSRGENRGFSKLDKRLDGFVDKSLMPFMNEHKPGEDSLGLRVYGIVSVDIARHVDAELANAQRIAAGFESYTDIEQDEIHWALMAAGKDYIDKIEALQARLDALHRREKAYTM